MLLQPVDITRVHEIGFLMSWHARFMVLAWAILMPVGVLVARFFKIMPGQNWPEEIDNRFWWRSHLWLQISGITIMTGAIGLIWFAPRHPDQAGLHSVFGWSVAIMGLLQALGGYFRGTKGGPTEVGPDGSLRGDHYDMTPRRLVFEYVHKFLGYGALVGSVIAIMSGLWQANAPLWMFVVLNVYWLGWLTAFIILQRRGMAFDTYRAIWGPDPVHPGNQRQKPVGFGVRREIARSQD